MDAAKKKAIRAERRADLNVFIEYVSQQHPKLSRNQKMARAKQLLNFQRKQARLQRKEDEASAAREVPCLEIENISNPSH